MNGTKRLAEHEEHDGEEGDHGRGMNAMGLLIAAGTAVIVAVFLVPDLGLLVGAGAGLLAGAFMFAMHGGSMGGHNSGTGDHRGHGC